MNERGRGRPRETSHDQIREVAIDLFTRNGYAKTSLAQIAEAAGISRTTLFAYFPSKRDLLWEDYEDRLAGLDEILGTWASEGAAVETIVAAMLANARYRTDEHDLLAQRKRIVEEDDELRAYAALAIQDLVSRLSRAAIRHVRDADPGVIDLVIRALMAAAAQCTDDWLAQNQPASSLDDYTAERLGPIVEALGPLLE